ncbi:UNVERIFIED_CONTAM: hypothetical protein HDU68_004915, partial [Siphonaria sp. JEL0065]
MDSHGQGFSFTNLFPPPQTPNEPKMFKRKIRQKKPKEKREPSFTFGHSKEPVNIKSHTASHPAPWLEASPFGSDTGLSPLDKEVAQLLRYLTPTPHEITLRQHVVAYYSNIIKARFPSSQTKPFGSTGTGLFLPWSDIDLIILDPYPSTAMEDPKQNTQSSKLGKLFPKLNFHNCASSVQFLRKARVPILKLVDSLTKLQVDICFNVVGGYLAVESVKEWVKRVEGLRELVLLVKLYLNGRDLNEVFTGGVGGYSIVVWCLAFLKLRDPETGTINMHESKASSPSRKRKHTSTTTTTHSHGTAFLQFCRFFGNQFDYHSLGIGFTLPDSKYDIPEPFLFDKTNSPHYQPSKPYLLTLLNPLDPRTDISRGSTKIQSVTSALATAASILEKGSPLISNSPKQKKPRKKYYERDFDRGYDPIRDDDHQSNIQVTPAASILSNIIFISKHMTKTRDLMAGVSLSLFGNQTGVTGLVNADQYESLDLRTSATSDFSIGTVDEEEFMVSGIMMQDSGDYDDDEELGADGSSEIIALEDDDEDNDESDSDIGNQSKDIGDFIPLDGNTNSLFTIDRAGIDLQPPSLDDS